MKGKMWHVIKTMYNSSRSAVLSVGDKSPGKGFFNQAERSICIEKGQLAVRQRTCLVLGITLSALK